MDLTAQGRDVDLLFGLDMLKAHQACIDLAEDCLRIKGRTVRFLPEHELPDNARMDANPESTDANASSSSAAGPSSNPGSTAVPNSFPGSGNTLGGAGTPSSQNSRPGSRLNPGTPGIGNLVNAGTPTSSRQTPGPSPNANRSGSASAGTNSNPNASQFPEKDIQVIMGMGGVSRLQAIQTLEAAGGNVEVAASLLFG
jgi:DNA damage-inducible protein 1